jgi:hypothetical protein
MRNAAGGGGGEGNKFKRMTEQKMRPCSGGMGGITVSFMQQ